MLQPKLLPSLEVEIQTSREKLLAALSGAKDVWLIRGTGNLGDDLIYAGTRRLLAGHRYREVSILKLGDVEGELAMVSGGGAWCRAYDDMARNFAEVEKRFERIIILPSSFDLRSPLVASILKHTKALVFARELVSYNQIKSICNADLAFDCAFFFAYDPYRSEGTGVLRSFRTDKEAVVGHVLPEGNNDISLTCESLDEWLWTIARHEAVETDRAHVMIAAAMLGKKVSYRPSNYHKLPAIAEYSLKSLPGGVLDLSDANYVRSALLSEAEKGLRKLPANFFESHRDIEVTVVMLSHNRLPQTVNALNALKTNVRVPFKLILLDNNSEPAVRARLQDVSAQFPQMDLILLDENLGCAGGRHYAFQRVSTPYVLLLDNDIELLPGSLEQLLFQFNQHAEAIAVTGRIVFPDGAIHLCGGNHSIENDVLFFGMSGGGSRYDEVPGKSGECKWVPGVSLVRTEFLKRFPYDLAMRFYYEDLDWCLRVAKEARGVFIRSVESIAIHDHIEKMPPPWMPIGERLPLMCNFLETLSYFYTKHGVIVEALFIFVPELGPARNPMSVASAKLLLELIHHSGMEWVSQMWLQGRLGPLFVVTSDYEQLLYREVESLRLHSDSFSKTRSWKLVVVYWELRNRLRSLIARLIGKHQPAPNPRG